MCVHTPAESRVFLKSSIYKSILFHAMLYGCLLHDTTLFSTGLYLCDRTQGLQQLRVSNNTIIVINAMQKFIQNTKNHAGKQIKI